MITKLQLGILLISVGAIIGSILIGYWIGFYAGFRLGLSTKFNKLKRRHSFRIIKGGK
jgi:membrane protein DedA with SNARE-associated domain